MKVRLLNAAAHAPEKKHPDDAGFDLYSPIDFQLGVNRFRKILLGIAIEISEDEVALVQGRSGLASNDGITTIGNVIDSGYRGEISATMVNHNSESKSFKVGDRIAQLLILKLGNQQVEVVDSLTESARGTAGFGSTGI
jgi:dUTP pyrophosphatase